MASGNFYPVAQEDDGYFRHDCSYFDKASSSLVFGKTGTGSGTIIGCFVRFTNVTIPQGATILTAHVTFQAAGDGSGTTCNANVYCNDVDDAANPANCSEANALSLTDPVAWDAVEAWTADSNYDTPQLNSIVQTVISRIGWVSGNDLTVVVRDNSSSNSAARSPKSWDGGWEYGGTPELYVEWTTGGGGTTYNETITEDFSLNDTTKGFQEFDRDFTEDLALDDAVLRSFDLALTDSFTLNDIMVPNMIISYANAAFSSTESIAFDLHIQSVAKIILPFLTCVATGHDFLATLSVTLPSITISATGLVGIVGNLSQALRPLTIQSHGLTGQIGSVIANLPVVTLSASASIERHGTLDLDLPFFYINAHGDCGPANPIFFVTTLNPKNMAVTEYELFDFNSFGFFNGLLLGAKSDGIYPLAGENDKGTAIDASWMLGQFLLDILRPRDLYLFGRGGGSYKAIIVGDEDTENEVTVSYLLANLNEERVKLPRGLEPTYMQIGFENVDGADFEIDYIQVYAQKMRTVRK